MAKSTETTATDPAATPTPATTPVPSIMQLATSSGVPEGARDPIRLMMTIAENNNLSETDRAFLIRFARDRFKNRRRMAYICLCTIIASAIFLYVGAFVDGFLNTTVLTVIANNADLFIWVNFFLTTIVGAYYGVTAWRPSS